MVADCGKPDWVEMRYRITNIESKNPDKVNRYHKLIIGKRCGIEYLGPGSACYLWIEGMYDFESYTRFRTSGVMGTKPTGKEAIIETQNTLYTLEWIWEGQGG